MPQRLTPPPLSDVHALRIDGDPVVDSHEAVASIVSSRLGRWHAELLAQPVRQPDGSVQWMTPLAGPVIAASALDPDTRAALERRAARMLDDIQGLGAQLAAGGGPTASVGVLLSQAARTPSGFHTLFSVDGKPVLAFWGHAEGPEAVLPASIAAPPVSAPPATALPRAAAAASLPAGPERAADERRQRWPIWFALMSLLLLIALLLMLQRCTPVAEDMRERIAEAEKQNKVLEDEIANRRLQRNQYQCVPDPPTVAEKKPEAEPAPEPEPPKQAEAPSPPPKPEPPKKQAAKSDCPGERPVAKTPQVVVVFDQSSSMNTRMPMNQQQMRDLQQGIAQGGPGAAIDAIRRAAQAQDRRMDVAKSAVANLVQRVPSDVSIGLVKVGGRCQAESVGFFPPAQRRALVGTIQQMEPIGGTPLTDGVARAAAMVDGVTRDALLIVVSDGAESCAQNPCALAAQIARAKPRLRINVVDIGGAGAGNCLAAATGGKVFTANDGAAVAEMTRRAGQESMAPAGCKGGGGS